MKMGDCLWGTQRSGKANRFQQTHGDLGTLVRSEFASDGTSQVSNDQVLATSDNATDISLVMNANFRIGQSPGFMVNCQFAVSTKHAN